MIDLHLHIDGSLPLRTVQKLARLANVSLPPEEEGLWDLLSVPADCASLNDYLRCFNLPVELLWWRNCGPRGSSTPSCGSLPASTPARA